MQHLSTSLRLTLLGWCGFGLFISLFSANALLSSLAFAVVPMLVVLLWRPGEPPILLFAVLFQWLQASTRIFDANVRGVDLAVDFGSSAITVAAVYAMVGLVVLSLGMRLSAGKPSDGVNAQCKRAALTVSHSRVLAFYAVFLAISAIVVGVRFSAPQLAQILLSFAQLKYLAIFVLAYSVLVSRKGWMALVFVVGLEIALGITGYFSSGFVKVLMITSIAYVMARPQLRPREVWPLAALAALFLLLVMTWTAIKPEYRSFMNGGTGNQTILVSRTEQYQWLADRISTLEVRDLTEALSEGLKRLAYIDYFAYAIEFVPAWHAHEGGALWGRAIQHIATPRLLFPEKPPLPSDSELTRQYTGQWVASGEQGTSISMGYMAESYIDFGFPVMFAPIFVLGLLWGWIYRTFTQMRGCTLLNCCATAIVLFGAYQFEIHTVKLLGSIIMMGIVVYVLALSVFPKLMWLLTSRERVDNSPKSFASTFPST